MILHYPVLKDELKILKLATDHLKWKWNVNIMAVPIAENRLAKYINYHW